MIEDPLHFSKFRAMRSRGAERQRIKQLPEFNATETFSTQQLEDFASQILREDRKENAQAYREGAIPKWLDAGHLAYRKAAEVYSSTGEIDPAYVSGLYKRTYPERLNKRSELGESE